VATGFTIRQNSQIFKSVKIHFLRITRGHKSFTVRGVSVDYNHKSLMLNLTKCSYNVYCINYKSQAVHQRCTVREENGKFDPCKIVTPENFSSTVYTHDYVGDGNHCANFGENRFSGGLSPSR